MNKCFFIVACFVISNVNIQAQNEQPKIIVGPNIQVSHDGNSAHCEIKFSANPLDPNVLAGGVIKCPPNNDISNDKYGIAYVSRDGGLTWEGNEFNDVIKTGGGDPLAEFGLHGTMIFHSFGGGDPKTPNGNSFYTSKDDGKTWSKALALGDKHYGLPQGGDRPQIAVDRSFGKYAGRVYVTYWSAMGFGSGNVGWLVHSDDDCKSFVGPMKVTDYPSLAMDILISSSGKAFFLFYNMDRQRKTPGNINMLISDDGGATIAASKNIPYNFPWAPGEERMLSPFFAIDNKSEKFRDRIYGVYTDTTGGKGRIKFIYSSDEGNSWSVPRLIDLKCPAEADQSNVALAVNNSGVLGIRWSDTREMEGKGYNEYFTVSLDGGETFLPPVKVSSKPSSYLDFSHELVKPYWTRTVDKQRFGLIFHKNTMSYWGNSFSRTGGHYTQFAADARGVFHDFWTDSRDGEAYQIYTSAIEVEQPGVQKLMTLDEMMLQRRTKDAEKEKTNLHVKNKVSLVSYIAFSFGESTYDSIKQEISFPVRLKNISNKEISGPIKVVIDEIDTTKGRFNIPILLNAENKKKGEGACFAYFKTLSAGEMSETKVWKFRVKIPKDVSPGGSMTAAEREKVMEESMKGNYEYQKQLMIGNTAEIFVTVTGNISQ